MPKNRLKLLNFRIRIDDKNCTKYLYIDRTLNKSSQRLINISGKHNSDKGNLEDNFSENKVNKSNTNKGIMKDKPPPLGIGILCKLLLLGLSKEYLVRKIIKFFKIKKVEKIPRKKQKIRKGFNILHILTRERFWICFCY